MDINSESVNKSVCNYKDCKESTSNKIGWCTSCIKTIKETKCAESKLAHWCLEVDNSLNARNGVEISEKSKPLIDEIKKKLNTIYRVEQGLMKVGDL